MSDTSQTQTVEKRLSGIEEKLGQLETVSAALRELKTVPDGARKGAYDGGAPTTLHLPRGNGEKFSLGRFIAGTLGVKEMGFESSWNRFPYEKQVMEHGQAELKAMGEGTSTAGGFLVPAQYITELIEIVRAKTIADQLGVRRMGVNSNTGYIPRQTGASTAAWLAEAGTITASDLTFDQLQYTIRKLAAYAVVSNELINDSNPAVDSIIREDLAAAMALQEDYTILYGSGTAPTPRGVKNATGVTLTSLGVNGATPTFDNLIDLEANLRANNRRATGWAAAPRTTTTLRKVKDTQGRYIWEPAPYTGYVMPSLAATDGPGSASAGAIGNTVLPARPVGTILGIPYAESTQIPVNLTQGAATNSSDVFVGQWDEVLVLERGGIEFAASDQILFQNYQTAIRAIMRRDVLVRHGSAFAVAIGVLP